MIDEPSASPPPDDHAEAVDLDASQGDARTPPLTRARIVRAALRLIDTQGLPALTMRALATELTVSPMALYNHVADKEELLDLTLDLMLSEVDCSASEGNWLTQLRTLICNFHQALSAHQQLAKGYCGTVKIGPHGLKLTDRAIELLRQGGFSPPEADDAFMLLYTYTVGLHQLGHVASDTSTAAYDTAARIPFAKAVNPYLGGVHKPGRFEYGLDTLLAGLQIRRDQAIGTRAQP